MQGDQVGLLTDVELGLLAPQAALGLRHSHPLAGTERDQGRPRTRRPWRDVEQQSSHRVGGVVDGAATLSLTFGE